MLGTTHTIVGFGVGMLLSSGAGALPALAGGVIGGMVALLPDVDHPNSTISHKMGLFALPFRILPHRTITHSIWIPCVLILVFVIYPHWATLTVCVAYISHIIADMLTPRGVPLLYPIIRNSLALGLIRTGSLIERFLAVAMVMAIAIYIWEMVL